MTPQNSLDLREALLRALAIDREGRLRRGAALLRSGPEEEILLLPSGDLVILRSLEAGDGAGRERLEARTKALLGSVRGRVSLVVCGNDDPFSFLPRSFGSPLTVFSVSAEGRLAGGGFMSHAARTVAPTLRAALKALEPHGGPPPTEAERAALLEAGEAVRAAQGGGEEATFWSRISQVTPWGTYTLIGAIAFVFALECLWGGADAFRGSGHSGVTLYQMGANAPERVREGELFRLFAAAFLHIGYIHLLVNLWALRVFGDFLERVLGTAAFLVVYALSALSGSLSSVFLGSATLSAGASGALWGLMVGSFALSFWGDIPAALRLRIRSTGLRPILVNLAISFVPGIDMWAHFGGGLLGGVLVLAGTRLAPKAGPLRALLVPLAALLCVLMALSVVAAILVGHPWERLAPVS
jgi:membrane associated rhomboid family serine protease